MIKIPRRYENAKYEDIPENIVNFLQNLDEERKGIYIHGGVGTGKTHIIYAMAKRANEKGFGLVIKNIPELLKEFRFDFSRNNNDKEFEEEHIMKYQGLLILDDVGSEKMSDWVEETFYLIINKRYNEMLPTIFTSNLNLSELADRIGDRIVSRIAGSCEVVELKGEDKRLTK